MHFPLFLPSLFSKAVAIWILWIFEKRFFPFLAHPTDYQNPTIPLHLLRICFWKWEVKWSTFYKDLGSTANMSNRLYLVTSNTLWDAKILIYYLPEKNIKLKTKSCTHWQKLFHIFVSYITILGFLKPHFRRRFLISGVCVIGK